MKKLFAIFSIGFVLCSCNKVDKKPSTTPNPQDTIKMGTIAGTVTQYDQYSAQYTVGLNTTQITVDGTTLSAISNASGNYTITNIPTGTYTVKFNKFGCGLYQRQNVLINANGTTFVSGFAVTKPTYTLSSATLVDSAVTHKIFITVNMVPVNEVSGVLVISGNTNGLDIANPASYSAVRTASIPANSASYTFLNGIGQSGTTYYRIYPYPYVLSASSYYDYTISKPVYSSYGAPVDSVYADIVP